jgi:putative NIF3 family GTP cyclohydrolase 1 type 2
MIAPRARKRALVSALRSAHPYEEPAFDWIEVGQEDRWTGLGAVGTLAARLSSGDFLQHVCTALGTPAVRAIQAERPIRRVAVCGGSGSSFLPLALAAGADAYVTADLTYHLFFDALDAEGQPRLTYVDAGHYETERVTEELLVRALSARFDQLEIARTALTTDPSAYVLAQRQV